jgi:hypothetical protein
VTALDAEMNGLKSNAVSFFLQAPSWTTIAPDFFWHSTGAAAARFAATIVTSAEIVISDRGLIIGIRSTPLLSSSVVGLLDERR